MGLCRQMPNAQRVEQWVQVNGPVPDGMRIGWTCAVHYCGNLAHMELAADRTAGWMKWKSIADQILALPEGGKIEVDIPHSLVLKMRCALSHSLKAVHIITRNISRPFSKSGIEIIRVGEYHGDRAAWLRDFPIKDTKASGKRPWQRSSGVWMGQFFNPMSAKEFTKPAVCKVAGCVMPTLHGSGDYCYHHNHWFDYPISMTDSGVDRSSMWSAREPNAPYELVAERILGMAALERSLRVERGGFTRHDHKNAGGEAKPEKVKLPTPLFSSGRLRHRTGNTKHTSSKTSRGRHRAASRKGPGGRHSAKEKRWTRETIESLEQQANAILGEAPIDCAVNFIPPEERGEYGEEYERDIAVAELGQSNEFERIFGA